MIALALFAWGAGVRLVNLAERPMNADESLHAATAWDIATGRGYRFDPEHHGPLGHHLTAAFLGALGDSDAVARLPWALSGVALLMLAIPLGRRRGPAVALAFLALTALSPTYAFLCREIRGDTLGIALLFAALLSGLRGGAAGWAAAVALTFAIAMLKGTSLLGLGLATAAGIGASPVLAVARLRRIHRRELLAAGVAALAGALAYAWLYTGFFEHLEDWNGMGRLASHWLARHHAPHYPGSVWYYPAQLAVYEPVICAFALAALLGRDGQGTWLAGAQDPWRRFLALWLGGALIVHGWAEEKLPHIALYALLPATLLAAEALARLRARAVLAAVAVALAITGAMQFQAVVSGGLVRSERPARLEAIIFRSMAPGFRALAQRVRRDASAQAVAADGLAYYLLRWPLRGLALVPLDEAPAGALRVRESSRGELVSCTWRPRWEAASLQDVLSFALTRRPFGPVRCQKLEIVQ